MGAKQTKIENDFCDAINCDSGARVGEALLQYPELANATLHKGTTNPMCRASWMGNNNIILLLIKYGSDINARSREGRTPIMYAAMKGWLPTVELLLENGADKDLTDAEGLNVFDICVIQEQYKIAQFLYSKHGMTRNQDERDLLYKPEPHGHQFDVGKLHRSEGFDIDLFFAYLE